MSEPKLNFLAFEGENGLNSDEREMYTPVRTVRPKFFPGHLKPVMLKLVGRMLISGEFDPRGGPWVPRTHSTLQNKDCGLLAWKLVFGT